MNEDPFRLRILKNLTALLQTITVTNGYKFDLDKAIFRGRAVFGDGDPVPMVSILDAVKVSEGLPIQFDGTEAPGVWTLLLQGWTEDDLTGNPTDETHILLAEVKRCITQHRVENARNYSFLGMGGKVTDIRYNGGVVRPSEDVSGKSFFWLLLDLALVEDLLNPYA